MEEKLEKTEIIAPHNDHNPEWNDNIEKTIKDIGENCKSYKIMHLKTAQYFNQKYETYMKLGIVLGPSAGVLSGSSVAFEDNSTLLSLIITIVGFLSGVVVAILRFGNYEELVSNHKIAAVKYTSLESNVRRQLALYREDRISAKDYLEWVSSSFDELFLAAPLVPRKQYEKFVKQAKDIGLKIPSEYESTIQINETYESKKIEEMTNRSDISVNMKEVGEIRTGEGKVGSEGENESKYIDVEDQSVELRDMQFGYDKLKGNKKIKRTNTFSNYPDLGKYSDGMMNYEIRRMMKFSS